MKVWFFVFCAFCFVFGFGVGIVVHDKYGDKELNALKGKAIFSISNCDQEKVDKIARLMYYADIEPIYNRRRLSHALASKEMIVITDGIVFNPKTGAKVFDWEFSP